MTFTYAFPADWGSGWGLSTRDWTSLDIVYNCTCIGHPRQSSTIYGNR